MHQGHVVSYNIFQHSKKALTDTDILYDIDIYFYVMADISTTFAYFVQIYKTLNQSFQNIRV